MKIEYFRQEVMRLKKLLAKLRVMQDSSYHDRIKAVMLCLYGSGEGYSLDECEMILDDFDRYIEANAPDSWIVISILMDCYCIMDDDLNTAIWNYKNNLYEAGDIVETRMVEVDDNLLGEKRDCQEVYSYYCEGTVEEFEIYYDDAKVEVEEREVEDYERWGIGWME